MSFNIKKVTFSTILPAWKELWPHLSDIEQVSAITRNGSIDISIKNNIPTFLAYMNNGFVDGVLSGVPTGDGYFRSRGLWVNPIMRNKNIATELMIELQEVARNNNCGIIWSMPRKSAIEFYIKFGFVQTSNWFDEYEYGPHCFVEKNIGI